MGVDLISVVAAERHVERNRLVRVGHLNASPWARPDLRILDCGRDGRGPPRPDLTMCAEASGITSVAGTRVSLSAAAPDRPGVRPRGGAPAPARGWTGRAAAAARRRRSRPGRGPPRAPSGSTSSTGSPAPKSPCTRSRPRTAARCAGGPPPPPRPRRAPAGRAAWSRGGARTGGKWYGGRWRGTRCPPARRPAPRPTCLGRGEQHRHAGPGGDPGGVQLAGHPAGAELRRADADPDAGQVGVVAHLRHQPARRAAAGRRRTDRPHRTAGRARRPARGGRRARPAGRCRRTGSPRWRRRRSR